jgi:hypothetical protein
MRWRCRTSATERATSAAITPTSRDLGGWSERVEDPGQIGDAILRARRQTEDGRAALLEFITSQEQGFSRRRGAAE